MASIKIKKITREEKVDIKSVLQPYTVDGKVVFITENQIVCDNINNLKKDNLVAVNVTDVNHSQVTKIRLAHPDAKTVVIQSPRQIDRYFNETLNIKRIKAREHFVNWEVNVIMLSDTAVSNAMITHRR